MSVTPPVSLERALARHGDTLYRVALLLAPDEAAAARALVAAFQPPAPPPPGEELADLLPPLLAALAPHARPARPARSPSPDLARAFAALAFGQRRALVLQLLLGFAPELATGLCGVPLDELRADTAAGLAALADATGAPLPNEQPTEQCAPVRALIAQTPGNFGLDSQVRGHLALCAACRSFDHASQALAGRTEAALRARTRGIALPPVLAAAILAPRGGTRRLQELVERVGARRLALTLLPVGVLVLIAALVLPGFWRDPSAPASTGAAPADPHALVSQALAQRTRPPAGQGVLWHGQWQTRWYFPSGSVAPITLDAWLDPTSSTRHRLQVTHAQGGAPFELQVGDGRRSLYYVLSASYYDTLYGVPPPAREPQLRHLNLGADDQRKALNERMSAGVWGLDEAYLRLAQSAPDLRTLGRQRDGEHLVQLVRYRAISPLAPPADAPRVTGDGSVSILLALDAVDGRLRSVTELSGDEGGAQASEVVWRLSSEEWLANETQAASALDPARAWNGRGTFPRNADAAAPDSALLMANADGTSALERALARADPMIVLPAAPPPGIERALVLWNDNGRWNNNWPPPSQIIYLGPGKQLSVSWSSSGSDGPLEDHALVGDWAVSFQPRRPQLYRAWGAAKTQGAAPGGSGFMISAYGFTRAELVELIKGFGPLDLERWRAQRSLFDQPAVEPRARATLEKAIDAARPPAPNAFEFRRERSFSRANPAPDPLHDPYHLARYSSNPPAAWSETWLQGTGDAGLVGHYTEQYDANDTLTRSWMSFPGKHEWGFDAARNELSLYPTDFSDRLSWLDDGTRAALDFMANPGLGVAFDEGTSSIVRRQPIDRSDYAQLAIAAMDDNRLPFVADLNVSLVVTTLGFAADGSVKSTRTSVVGYGDGRRVERIAHLWNLEERRPAEAREAPSPFLNGGEPNVRARYVSNFREERPAPKPFAGTTISEAQVLMRMPLFVLPSDIGFSMLPIEAWYSSGSNRSVFGSEPLNDAARDGRGVWTHYVTDVGVQFSIFQGPAEPLADYLRTHINTPFWMKSEPLRTVIDGQNVQGWLMSNGKQDQIATFWYFAEVDGTLIIAQGGAWMRDDGLALLGQLRRVS